MITIIYPYRNRGQERIKKSLDSLKRQTNKDFDVLLVDYGSDLNTKKTNTEFLKAYNFLTYIYSYNIHQPWSRPKALNIGIKKTKANFVFFADIDMIFRNDFVKLLHELKNNKKSYFFQVGYLSKEESDKEIDFKSYKIKHKSTHEAQGLSLFKRDELLKINGHDEFINFWGADNDVHNRMQNNGIPSEFYDKELMILHQWHEIYANKQTGNLTKSLQVKGIANINSKLQIHNLKHKITEVNSQTEWGEIFSKKEYDELEEYDNPVAQETRKELVDLLLFVLLKRKKNGIMHMVFKKAPNKILFKQKLKKLMGKNSIEYYSLKEVNDKILTHLIADTNNTNYTYKVLENNEALELKIKF